MSLWGGQDWFIGSAALGYYISFQFYPIANKFVTFSTTKAASTLAKERGPLSSTKLKELNIHTSGPHLVCTALRLDGVWGKIQDEFRLTPSSHRPLAWFDVWSQSENYADFLKCVLLPSGCDMPTIYAKQKWRFLAHPVPQRRPLYSHSIHSLLAKSTCAYPQSSHFILCPYIPQQSANCLIFTTPWQIQGKRHLCWYQEVMLLSSALGSAATSSIYAWNYKVEGQISLQCGRDMSTQILTCPLLISLWFETIRTDLFWNNSSSYSNLQRSQDHSPPGSYFTANPAA